MKTAHTKNNAASNAHSPKHFFSKNGEGSPFFQLKEAEEPFFSPSVIQSKAPIWQPKGQLSSIKRGNTALQRKITGAGQRISHNSYTTFQIPLDKGLKFNIQFYKEPNNSEGALLKFKVHQDQRAPRETPIPAGTTFSPRIVSRSEQSVSFNFDSGNKIHLTVFIADRWKKESHDAINPTRPWGPLLMDKEFERRFVDASIAHVGGSEQYSWQEALPDEAVSPPIWQMYLHGGRLPGYRAIRGKYARRVLLFGTDIRPGERAAVRGFEAGAIISAKFIGSLLIYSIPYVGPAVMIGEAIAGRSIWGDKLSTEGRVLLGLLALIPVVRSLRSATASARAEATAATELAAAKGIGEAEALALIRGARTFSREEIAFIESASAQLKAGNALTEAQALRIATLVNRVGSQTRLIFSAANDIKLIWKSSRYWGQTEGAVYGARMPANTLWQRLKAMIGKKEGMVVFQGQAARLFQAHRVEGGYSAMKKLLGQHKAGFGDIIFENAVKEGNTIIVTRARLATAAEVQHAGQSTAWAAARLWGRRLTLEPLTAAGMASGGYGVYMLYDWITGGR